jgi:hypothetical protein
MIKVFLDWEPIESRLALPCWRKKHRVFDVAANKHKFSGAVIHEYNIGVNNIISFADMKHPSDSEFSEKVLNAETFDLYKDGILAANGVVLKSK